MIINHNMMAINSHRQLGVNSGSQGKSIEKLSSGMRVNRAGDDAAGLSISEKMRTQIRGLNQASRNAQDGISLIQTAEGALNETHDILQRMRELTVQAANDTNDTEARDAIKDELTQLSDEVTRIAEQTEFNGSKPLAAASDYNLQVGANKDQTINVNITAGMKASDLGIEMGNKEIVSKAAVASAAAITAVPAITTDGSITAVPAITAKPAVTAAAAVTAVPAKEGVIVEDNASANATLEKIDAAVSKVSKLRSKFGAVQNRLEHTIKNIDTGAENMQAAESRVRDVDMAKEMMNYTRSNILNQAAQSMLAQANQAPQGVLQLLR